MRPELVFVLPDDHDSITGGNLYNKLLIEALERNGCPPVAIDLARARSLVSTRRARVLVVDSVLREHVAELTAAADSRHPVLLLVHLLESFVSGDPQVAARERELLRTAAGFVATSEFTRGRLAELAGPRPVFVAPPGLAIEPGAVREPSTCFAALIVGNLVRCKRQIEVLEQLDSRLVDSDELCIDIVGRDDLEPDYAAACRSLIGGRKQLTGRARIHGVVPVSDMPRWYSGCTALVSAASMETYGMAVAEARACGVPVLAVDAGNLRAHVTSPDHGALLGSLEELAATCVRFIRDPGARAELVDRAARTRQTSCSTWDDAARALLGQLEEWYRELSP